MRALLLAVAVLAVACKYNPPGACSAASDCPTGEVCSGGICIGCSAAAPCEAWETCNADQRCEVTPGLCASGADCMSWQVCASHACETAPATCIDGAACQTWEVCSGDHTCVLAQGACNGDADCLPGQACNTAGHACYVVPLDPTEVHLFGTTTPAVRDSTGKYIGTLALAPVDTPAAARFGLDAVSSGLVVDADGSVVYSHLEPVPPSTTPTVPVIRRFVPDPLVWFGSWVVPANALADDSVLVPATACPAGNVQGFVLVPSSGGVRYACSDATNGFEWYDQTQTKVVSLAPPAGPLAGVIRAWTGANVKLVAPATPAGAIPTTLLDATNTAIPIVGLPSTGTVRAIRVNGTGFRVAIAGTATELWDVLADGTTAKEGTYATISSTYVASDDTAAALGADGSLYVFAARSYTDPVTFAKTKIDGYIYQLPLQPSASVLLYNATKAPAGPNAFSSKILNPYVMVEPTTPPVTTTGIPWSTLVTGP
jgi:hypothetical protein